MRRASRPSVSKAPHECVPLERFDDRVPAPGDAANPGERAGADAQSRSRFNGSLPVARQEASVRLMWRPLFGGLAPRSRLPAPDRLPRRQRRRRRPITE